MAPSDRARRASKGYVPCWRVGLRNASTTMSDHVWALENIAAYLAGGLDPTEGERLEQHAAQCAVCARALDEARSLECKLAPLFRNAKPGLGLEDRIIRAMPLGPVSTNRRRAFFLSWKARSVLAVAA